MLVVVGIAVSSVVQSRAVLGDVHGTQAVDLKHTQDRLLAQRSDLSKWLLGIAYATLVGLLGLQIKDDSPYKPASSALSMAAAGLLVISVFASFLFQQATIQALSSDINLIYGNYLEAPLQIQFYTLLTAFVLLIVWLFRPGKQLTLLAVAALMVFPCVGK
jgi:hypothetical protein